MNILLVGIGGMVGSMTRYGMSILLLNFTSKPLSFFTILCINLLGCFGIGILGELGADLLKPELRLLFITGFLGGFTTYSAFAFETFSFFENQNYLIAFLNIILHVAGGLLAVWLGSFIARSF